ncbi:hypothetical protein HYR69_02010, partial [Candidatus Sumerlaeota bacterium]|nr:hypothetical protein [Candidatus Sumerlaeota bacterium]
AIDGLPRWLASGETFNGVVHTNRHLFVYGTAGSPLTFNSDVQIVGSDVKQAAPNNVVVYNGQKQLNAPYVELPSDLSPLINASDNGGVHLPAADPTITPATYVDPVKKMNGASLVSNINNYQFTFNSNGTVSITNLDKYTWMTGRRSPGGIPSPPP